MRNGLVVSFCVFVTVFCAPSNGYSQIWGGQDAAAVDQQPPGAKSTAAQTATFDRRDFTGVWQTDHRGTNGYRGMTTEEGIPPRTPWADALFRSRLTGREWQAEV